MNTGFGSVGLGLLTFFFGNYFIPGQMDPPFFIQPLLEMLKRFVALYYGMVCRSLFHNDYFPPFHFKMNVPCYFKYRQYQRKFF